MPAANPARSLDQILRQISRFGSLNAEATALIRQMDGFQSHASGSQLADDRRSPGRPHFLVSGWAARVRWLPDGRRQIINFVLPCDGLAACVQGQAAVGCVTIALTPAVTLDATRVSRALASGDPAWACLLAAARVAAVFDETYLLNQVVRLGRQTAFERLCHLLLELHQRLCMSGVGDDRSFPMPLTQETLADVTGLSVVHTNRMLQRLRRERLVSIRDGRVTLLEPERLALIADFRPF